MKNKKQTIALIAVGVLLVVSIVTGLMKPKFNKPTPTPESNINSGTSSEKEKIPVPNFKFWDMDKNEVEFDSFKGKPIVINFWATWCGYCVQEMPDFDKLIGEYKDDVNFIMLNVLGGRETEEKVLAFLKKHDFKNMTTYYDGLTEGTSLFGIRSFPTTVFIDKDGNLFDATIGMTNYDAAKAVIDKMLGE